MSPRIAIIIERADIALGGAERSVFEVAAALRSRGLGADVLAAKGQSQTPNVQILCADQRGKRTSLHTFAMALREHLKQQRYDLVHSVLPIDFADVYQPRGGAYAEAMIRNADSYPTALLRTVKRTTGFLNARRTALLRAERRLCRAPQGPMLAALSHYVAEQFKRHYGAADERIVVIPNGVRLSKRLDKERVDMLRAQILASLDITEAERPLFMGFVANNFRLKGLTPLITALARSRSQGRPVFLIVAGAGRSGRYRLLARRLNVHERIVFLGPVRHVQNVLAISEVAVLPTFYDPSSRFILEALAAGRPVITTGYNGAADLFVDKVHGRVVDSPDNVETLAEAITHFSDESNIRAACAAIEADDLRQKVCVDRVAGQLIELYERILARRGKRQY